MEREDDSDRDNGHIDREAKVGEEGALVCAVVASIRGLVVEEERSPPGFGEEDGAMVARTGRLQ